MRAGVDIKTIADVDRPGVRVGVVTGTSTSRTVARSLQHATVTAFPEAEAAAALLGQGQINVLATGTDALTGLARSLPGARALDKLVQSTGVVVTVPKNRPATRAWAAQFIEEPRPTAPCVAPSTAPVLPAPAVAPPAR